MGCQRHWSIVSGFVFSPPLYIGITSGCFKIVGVISWLNAFCHKIVNALAYISLQLCKVRGLFNRDKRGIECPPLYP